MKITAIAPWFGGKRTLGKEIAAEAGRHRAYYTLGCGSLSDLFAKEPSPMETAVDLHHHAINLCRVIQEDDLAPKLYRRLQRVVCSEDLFERSRRFYASYPEVPDAEIPSLEAAFHFFLTSWIGRNGVAGTERQSYQMAVRWTPGGGHGGIRFRSATESLPAWHRRLRHTLFLRRDMFDVLSRIHDTDGVVIYVDPPYLRQTRGGARYQHEFDDRTGTKEEDQDDHARLAELARRFRKVRLLISYYDHERFDRLYPGWTKRSLTRQKNLHVQNRRGAGQCEAPEVLLINGPSFVDEQGRLF